MIGIGVVTYNRVDYLRQVIEAVFQYTAEPYCLVVADDGSQDETADLLSDSNITRIGGSNRGIAWNKNRALYTLRHFAGAEVIILLEDDTLPHTFGWEAAWIAAAKKAGYATYAHPKMKESILKGTGTVDDPYACTGITSQCSTVTREALDRVGYFDTRFKGYGVEDGEWSTRLRRCDYGIARVDKDDGGYIKANFMIEGGVHTLDVKTYRDNDSVARNREIYDRIRNEPLPRQAWRDDAEKSTLIHEIRMGIAHEPLLIRSEQQLWKDVAQLTRSPEPMDA
jgi:glycosyltransferase involved in cell wall biosynthesis